MEESIWSLDLQNSQIQEWKFALTALKFIHFTKYEVQSILSYTIEDAVYHFIE